MGASKETRNGFGYRTKARESLPFSACRGSNARKNFFDTEEISVIGIPLMATNDLNQVFY